ncbi:hypothetical protein FOZ63_003237, partial [Perkinsus olseni]
IEGPPNKNYLFVVFTDPSGARNCLMENPENHVIDGVRVDVKKAQPRNQPHSAAQSSAPPPPPPPGQQLGPAGNSGDGIISSGATEFRAIYSLVSSSLIVDFPGDEEVGEFQSSIRYTINPREGLPTLVTVVVQ